MIDLRMSSLMGSDTHFKSVLKNIFCLILIYFMSFVLWFSIAFKLSICGPELLKLVVNRIT